MSKTRGVFEKVVGSNIWWIRYVDAVGKYRREKVGTWSAANKLLTSRKNGAAEGAKLPDNLRKRLTFGELAEDAIAYIQKNYARPADDVARLRLLMEHITVRVAVISRRDFLGVVDTLASERNWSAGTKNHYLNVLTLTFRLAIENEKVKDSPLRDLRRKEGNKIVRYLTPEEEKKLRDAIRSKPEWAEHEPEFDLAIHTGLRRGSMYRDLVWENVDLAGRVAIIPKTKNGEGLAVPLNDAAMRALQIFRSRGDGKGRVVRNLAGETLNVNAHWFVPAVRAAGIENFRWHDCRHTYASRLRQAGVPLGNIAELLGHKGLEMSRRYAHLAISNLHEAVSRLSNSTTVAPEPKTERAGNAYVN